jgi:hypothetical protein
MYVWIPGVTRAISVEGRPTCATNGRGGGGGEIDIRMTCRQSVQYKNDKNYIQKNIPPPKRHLVSGRANELVLSTGRLLYVHVPGNLIIE